MNQKIRRSVVSDAEYFVEIKDKLPLPLRGDETQAGGFLLGTDIQTYQFYIKNGYCLTAEVNDEIVGFGILLPDSIIRGSELWQKRHMVNWSIDLEFLEQSDISYIEQLAFLRGHMKLSMILAYNLVKTIFDKGTDFILTTTVKKPITNLAAVPFIKAIGGRKVGNIDENYPVIGYINSDIYQISNVDFYEKVKAFSFYSYLKMNEIE